MWWQCLSSPLLGALQHEAMHGPPLYVGLFFALLILWLPTWKALKMSAWLLLSQRVVVREYQRFDLAPESLLTEVTLARWQSMLLALVFVLPPGAPLYNRCLFVPHHEIAVTGFDGTVRRALICFSCLHLGLAQADQPTRSVGSMGPILAVLLTWTFRAQGVPVRRAYYR